MSEDHEPIGRLRVDLTFYVDVYDLFHFSADSLDEAAKNLQHWYFAGETDIVGDYQDSDEVYIRVSADRPDES